MFARRLVLSAAVLLRRHATLIREGLVNSPIHGRPESRLPLTFQRLEASVFMEKLVMPCGIGFPYVILAGRRVAPLQLLAQTRGDALYPHS